MASLDEPQLDRMPEATPQSDRFLDFSLRLLTLFVLVALAGCVAFLAYRFLAPHFTEPDPGRFASPHVRPSIQPSPALAGPALGDEVLMDPHRAFRCVNHGSVTFSDHACPDADASESTIPLAKPATPASH
jgi:hypothetical protein